MCKWCQKPCEGEFCDEKCYNEYEEAWAEYAQWSRAYDMVDGPEKNGNEWCGSKGNNT